MLLKGVAAAAAAIAADPSILFFLADEREKKKQGKAEVPLAVSATHPAPAAWTMGAVRLSRDAFVRGGSRPNCPRQANDG